MADKPNSFNSTRVFSAGSGDLFDGFFDSARKWNFQKQDLIDGRARRVFEMMGQACDVGVYPYQLPLEGRSGPWVKAEGREFNAGSWVIRAEGNPTDLRARLQSAGTTLGITAYAAATVPTAPI